MPAIPPRIFCTTMMVMDVREWIDRIHLAVHAGMHQTANSDVGSRRSPESGGGFSIWGGAHELYESREQ